jgi:hypothetical protein
LRHFAAAFALIERHAATIKELDHPFWAVDLEADQALLVPVRDRAPAVWLGLSHLHTLRGVDLCHLSTAAIAAALPRLHSLAAFSDSNTLPAAVDGFFEDLLPRLRSFRFRGCWPARNRILTLRAPPGVHLPLQELVWNSRDGAPSLMRGFSSARPSVLHVPYHMVKYCFVDGDTDDAQCELLTRVRDLSLRWLSDPSNAMRVLHAAPQLRKFTAPDLTGDFLWQACDERPRPQIVRRLEGLFHPRLRSIDLRYGDADPPAGCMARLRQLLFPRLQSVFIRGKLFEPGLDDNR